MRISLSAKSGAGGPAWLIKRTRRRFERAESILSDLDELLEKWSQDSIDPKNGDPKNGQSDPLLLAYTHEEVRRALGQAESAVFGVSRYVTVARFRKRLFARWWQRFRR